MSKETKEPEAVEAVTAIKKTKYKIVGLKEAPSMPIRLGGRGYDLANLTEEQLESLLAQGCPYVVKG